MRAKIFGTDKLSPLVSTPRMSGTIFRSGAQELLNHCGLLTKLPDDAHGRVVVFIELGAQFFQLCQPNASFRDDYVSALLSSARAVASEHSPCLATLHRPSSSSICSQQLLVNQRMLRKMG